MLSRFLGLALLALALPLGSCAVTGALQTAASATVSTRDAGAAIAFYNTAEATAQAYLDRPLCTADQTTVANACREKGPSATLNDVMDRGDAARQSLQGAITAAKAKGTGIGVASALYQAVKSAITNVKQATPA